MDKESTELSTNIIEQVESVLQAKEWEWVVSRNWHSPEFRSQAGKLAEAISFCKEMGWQKQVEALDKKLLRLKHLDEMSYAVNVAKQGFRLKVKCWSLAKEPEKSFWDGNWIVCPLESFNRAIPASVLDIAKALIYKLSGAGEELPKFWVAYRNNPDPKLLISFGETFAELVHWK
jgi:hypothetical protein